MQRILEMLAGSTTPWEHALDGVIAVMIAAVCLLAPTAALLLRPLSKGEGKRYWLYGALYEVLVHGVAWYATLGNGGLCVLAAALAIVQGLLLREYAADHRRLIAALGVQALLTVMLYIVLDTMAVTAIMMWMYR